MAEELIDRVRGGFHSVFERDADGVWSAPGRVSIGGDHTDLQDGVSFAFAIDERTAVAVAARDDDAVTVATDLTPERATARLSTMHPATGMDDWRAYPLGMVWAVLEHAREAGVTIDTGVDVFLSTDLPVGGGLASSASVCAAMGVALRDVWRLDLPCPTLAELAHTTEVHAAKATAGLADHVTVLQARADHDVFYDVRGRDASLIARQSDDGLVGLVVGTGELHRNWSSAFADRHDACARVAAALDRQTLREVRVEELEANEDRLDPTDLRRARHVVTEIARTLELTRVLRTEGAAHIGGLLRASQVSLRDDFEVSTERIDATCALAEHLGALGARMSGTGLGGSVFVLLPRPLEASFTEAIAELFREHGWDAPSVRRATAGAGARRDV